MNGSDVTKTVTTTNIKQCSNECERMLCNAYSFGYVISCISVPKHLKDTNINMFIFRRLNELGDGTCLLGLDLPKSGPYDDPEYDLFMKILQCRDRTSKSFDNLILDKHTGIFN